jgi:hypothetical protein
MVFCSQEVTLPGRTQEEHASMFDSEKKQLLIGAAAIIVFGIVIVVLRQPL